MPELPEVETTVRDLHKKLIDLKFKDVWTDWPKTFKKAGGFDNFKKTIKNKKILNIRRRAKFIVIDIEDAYSIFIHQKISGHLLYGKWKENKKLNIKNQNDKLRVKNSQIWVSTVPGAPREDPKNGYIRTVFFLSNGYQLAFSDLRRFGKIILVKNGEVEEIKEIKKLGPEPLEISFNEFKNLFANFPEVVPEAGLLGSTKRKKGRIKQVLMDPFFIAGIGNIYSDEILWDSGFHPLSRVENFSDSDLKKIFNSTAKILKKAIELGGSSMEDYRMPSGEKGKYQNQTKAYQREGEKCSKKDGGIIQRIKIGGRSAHFCPKHQALC